MKKQIAEQTLHLKWHLYLIFIELDLTSMPLLFHISFYPTYKLGHFIWKTAVMSVPITVWIWDRSLRVASFVDFFKETCIINNPIITIVYFLIRWLCETPFPLVWIPSCFILQINLSGKYLERQKYTSMEQVYH